MKQPRNLKKPGAGGSSRIQPRKGGGNSSQGENVTLSFECFNSDCISSCTTDKLTDWTEKLKRLTSGTWQAVTQAGRKGHGSETITRKQLTFPIPELFTEDTKFLSFRFGKSARMIGVRREAVLLVLWLTCNHDAY